MGDNVHSFPYRPLPYSRIKQDYDSTRVDCVDCILYRTAYRNTVDALAQIDQLRLKQASGPSAFFGLGAEPIFVLL